MDLTNRLMKAKINIDDQNETIITMKKEKDRVQRDLIEAQSK